MNEMKNNALSTYVLTSAIVFMYDKGFQLSKTLFPPLKHVFRNLRTCLLSVSVNLNWHRMLNWNVNIE